MFSKHLTMALLFLVLSTSAQAGFIVIANTESGLEKISAAELRKVYLKKIPVLPNGQSAQVVGLKEGSAREVFLKTVLRKSESSLNSYWSRLMFSGRATPPRLFNSDQEVLDYVKQHAGAIGFINSETSISGQVQAIEVY